MDFEGETFMCEEGIWVGKAALVPEWEGGRVRPNIVDVVDLWLSAWLSLIVHVLHKITLLALFSLKYVSRPLDNETKASTLQTDCPAKITEPSLAPITFL